MKTRITDLFGIEFPIIQAPMAGVSTPPLARDLPAADLVDRLARETHNSIEQLNLKIHHEDAA